MSGLTLGTPRPTEIILHRQSRTLELAFDDGERVSLPFEFLRVYSPSAEVRGHGEGQSVLQTGKKDVVLEGLEPVGHYALRLIFSDGHDSGLYSWDLLYDFGQRQAALWQDYLARLEMEGGSRERDPGVSEGKPLRTCSKYPNGR